MRDSSRRNGILGSILEKSMPRRIAREIQRKMSFIFNFVTIAETTQPLIMRYLSYLPVSIRSLCLLILGMLFRKGSFLLDLSRQKGYNSY